MRINIHYGGRGLIGDPSLYVIKKMMQVFEELNVRVEKYDLYDQKNNIATLPQTLKEADGIILATTVEWHGVGGYMMQFLDACWLYGDKELMQKIYMAPVVLSTTYGEKEAELDLTSAWETLGGITCKGLCGYITDVTELEGNEGYGKLIEKSAENIYRSISQKSPMLPVSNKVVVQKVNKTRNTFLTQQETEQLSEYASNETYVKKQKEDIRELADFFRGQLTGNKSDSGRSYEDIFQSQFRSQPGVHLKYKITLKDKHRVIPLRIDNGQIDTTGGDLVYPDAELTTDSAILDAVTEGRKTFQGGFMEGSIVFKGDFKNLRLLDTMFPFMEAGSKK